MKFKKKYNKATIAAAVAAAGVLTSAHRVNAAAFGSGDLVVEQIGSGAAALSSAAQPVYVDEFSSTTAGQTTPIQNIFTGITDSGSAGSAGFLNLSADGSTIVVPGYVAANGTAGVTASNSPRAIATVSNSGTASTSVTITDGAYPANNIRSATSTNGTTFYTSGTGANTSGERMYTAGSGTGTSVDANAPSTNLRVTSIQNGNLYFSTGSVTPGIYSLGPVSGNTAPTGTATLLIGTGASTSPYAFAISSDGTTAYVADSALGIEKYTNANGTGFTLAGTFNTGATLANGAANTAIRGSLTVNFNTAGGATLYYTNAGTGSANSPSSLLDFVDTGSFAVTPTVLATAATNEVFAGVAFAPTAVPEPATWLAGALSVLTLAWAFARRGLRVFGVRGA